MYAKLNLSSGCTLQQLRNDLVGLLTGTITTVGGLTSAAGASEIVNTLAAEWTFVQHLADTSTRCHFVLNGVDDGGVQKTLGIVLTNTSGNLGFQSWMCGPWNLVTKRPAGLDGTAADWKLAAAYVSLTQLEEGGVRNGICLHGNTLNPLNIGAFSGGTMQLQVASVAGATFIASHLSATHLILLDVVDVPRNCSPELAADKWPFVALHAYSKAQGSGYFNSSPGPQLILASSENQTGLSHGPSAWQLLSGGLAPELGAGCRYWLANSNYAGSSGSLDFVRESSPIFRWYPRKDGVYQYVPRLNILAPRAFGNFYLIPYAVPIPYQIPGQLSPVGALTVMTVSYLDELVAGSDTYVGTGDPTCMIYKG